MRVAGLVEEPFEDDALEGRQRAERRLGCAEILDELLGSRVVHADFASEPVGCRGSAALEPLVGELVQTPH